MHRRTAIAAVAVALTAGQTMPVSAAAFGGPANADFEACDTSDWTISGTAFSVTRETTWWGGTYDQHGACFLSGYLTNQDAGTGSARSSTFTATDELSFLIAGGWDPQHLYVQLVRASDGAVLDRQTGYNSEQLARITWDTAAVRGQSVYLQAVDTATGGWGHLNLDDVRTSNVDDAGTGLTARRLGSARQPAVTYRSARSRYAADPLRP